MEETAKEKEKTQTLSTQAHWIEFSSQLSQDFQRDVNAETSLISNPSPPFLFFSFFLFLFFCFFFVFSFLFSSPLYFSLVFFFLVFAFFLSFLILLPLSRIFLFLSHLAFLPSKRTHHPKKVKGFFCSLSRISYPHFKHSFKECFKHSCGCVGTLSPTLTLFFLFFYFYFLFFVYFFIFIFFCFFLIIK